VDRTSSTHGSTFMNIDTQHKKKNEIRNCGKLRPQLHVPCSIVPVNHIHGCAQTRPGRRSTAEICPAPLVQVQRKAPHYVVSKQDSAQTCLHRHDESSSGTLLPEAESPSVSIVALTRPSTGIQALHFAIARRDGSRFICFAFLPSTCPVPDLKN
jgi:hypothetical protein